MTVASMIYSIEAKTSSIESSLANVTQLVEKTESKMLSSITAGVALGEMFEHVAEAVGQTFLKALEAVPELLKHTIDVGNQLYEMSLKTGGSVEQLSALRYVAGQTGIDFESFGTVLFKMQQALGASGTKADEMQKHLSVLGLDLQTLKNEKPDQAFINIMSALERIPNRADQAAAGMAIFGKTWKEFGGLAQENIKQLIQDADDLGLVMTTKQAAAAHAAQVGWNSFTMQLESAAMAIASVVMPALVTIESLLSQGFQSAMKNGSMSTGLFREIVKSSAEGLLQFGIIAVDVSKNFYDVFSYAFAGVKTVIGILGTAIVGLAEGFLFNIELIARAASYLPGVGDKFGEMDRALQGAQGKLAAFGQTFVDMGLHSFDTTRQYDGFFTSAENGLVTLKGNFETTYDATLKKIDEFAANSHKAFGGVGADVEGSMNDFKQWQKVVEQIHLETFKLAMEHEKAWREQALKGADEINKAVVAGFLDIQKASRELADLEMQQSMTSTAYQVVKIREWADQAKQSFKGTADQAKIYFAIIDAEAAAKTDNLYIDWQTIQKESIASLQATADRAFTTYEYMTAHSEQFSKAAIQHQKNIAIAAQQAADGTRTAWQQTFDALPKALEAAFNAGSVLTFFEDMGKSIGGSISDGISQKLGSDGDFWQSDKGKAWSAAMVAGAGALARATVDAITKEGQVAHYAAVGAEYGSVAGPYGMLIGAGIGALVGALKVSPEELSGRDTEAKFEKTMGGLAGMQKALMGAGLSAETANAEIQGLWQSEQYGSAAVQTHIDMINGLLKTEQDAFDGVLTAGKNLGGYMPKALQDQIAKLMELNGLTDDQKAKLQGMLDANKPTFDQLVAIGQKYGMTLQDLGPKFQQAGIEKTAKGIYDDFTTLAESGANVGAVLNHMQKPVQDLIDQSKKFGLAVPDNMQPMIQKMIDAGLLTDDTGGKLKDLSGIKFEETPIDKAMKTFTDQIDRLVNLFSHDLPDSITNLSKLPVPGIHIPVTYDVGNPDGGSPATAALGGLVTNHGIQYLASGGNVLFGPWSPRGTDTVPAMLTPGELVLDRGRASAYLNGARASGGGQVVDFSEMKKHQAETNARLASLERTISTSLPRAIGVAVNDNMVQGRRGLR